MPKRSVSLPTCCTALRQRCTNVPKMRISAASQRGVWGQNMHTYWSLVVLRGGLRRKAGTYATSQGHRSYPCAEPFGMSRNRVGEGAAGRDAENSHTEIAGSVGGRRRCDFEDEVT
jgi:hypothetical protein